MLIGGAPYRAAEIAAVLGVELFGTLPEDASGAALTSGAWGRRAARSPLARGAVELLARVDEALYGRQVADGRRWRRHGGGCAVKASAVWRTPLDPTLGEVDEEARRRVVREIADTVGKRVARKVQDATAAGAPLSGEAEKVAAVTEIHRELAGVQRVAGACRADRRCRRSPIRRWSTR